MKVRQQMPAWAISGLIHVAIGLGLGLISSTIPVPVLPFAVESVLSEEREIEEFTQTLDQENEVSENLNFSTAGGVVTGAVGGSESVAVAQEKLEITEETNPTVEVKASEISLPGLNAISEDLGPGEVSGEVGAVVEGYGTALDLMTKEIIRMMRQDKLLVIWLFDESESMKDDQQELKTRIARVYEELNLYEEDEAAKGKRKKEEEVLLTAIVSYGAELHYQMPNKGKPSTDNRIIMQAIENIPIDKTGAERTCKAITSVLNNYRSLAVKRKMVMILVSDESGDDGEYVEETLGLAKQLNTPIYVMGRESVFGNLYAYVNWVDPATGGHHYLPIRRGPETPFAEQLPFEGFARRLDSHLSGFGPYEQVRLARETGGIFFMLPHEEQNINDIDQRKYEALDMREYLPNLGARVEYQRARDGSPFRAAMWNAIRLLNPYEEKPGPPQLKANFEIPIGWLDRDPQQYGPVLLQWRERILRTMGLIIAAEQEMMKVEKLRDKEPSQRWRASYDLILGQLMAYRLRLFEYMIGLDQHARSVPTRKFNDPKSNQWYTSIGAKDLLAPDAGQERLFKVTKKDLEELHERAQKQLQSVIDKHPRTPWAKRAEWEIGRGFGPVFNERFYTPPPPNPNPPKPTPIPQL